MKNKLKIILLQSNKDCINQHRHSITNLYNLMFKFKMEVLSFFSTVANSLSRRHILIRVDPVCWVVFLKLLRRMIGALVLRSGVRSSLSYIAAREWVYWTHQSYKLIPGWSLKSKLFFHIRIYCKHIYNLTKKSLILYI